MLAVTNADADQVGIAAARGGGMWLFNNKELRKYRHGTELSRLELPEPRISVWSMFEDSRHNLWTCTPEQGIRQVSSAGQVRCWTPTNGLSSNSTTFVFEDREQDLWLGTGGGLQRFKPRRTHSFVAEARSSVSSVSAGSAEDVWVASYGQGLFRRNASGVTKIALPKETATVRHLQSVLEDHLGRVWVGTYGRGLCLLDKENARVFSARDTGGGNVIALFEDSQGRVWVSGGEAASVYEGGKFRVFGPEDGLPQGAVYCFAEGNSGEVWLAHQDGVFRLQKSRFASVKDESGQPLHDIACLRRDASGAMWMGSNVRGLIRRREGRLAILGAASRAYAQKDGEAAWGASRSSAYGSASAVKTTERSGAAKWNTPEGQGELAKTQSGNYYGAKDGTVHKKDLSGGWSSNSGNGWNSISKATAQTASTAAKPATEAKPTTAAKPATEATTRTQSPAASSMSTESMEAQHQARQYGNQRSQRASQYKSGGGRRR